MLHLIKKAVKWYFTEASKTYNWLPSGMLPYDF